MQPSLLARPSFRPSLLGLALGAATSILLSAVLLGASAAADREPSHPQAVLEATHLPPLLVAAGEQPKLTFDGLVGIFGPTKMPKDLRDKIAADVKEVLAMPEVNDRLIATGQNVSPGTPDQFEAAMKKQIAEVAKVGKELDIKPGQN